MPGKFKKRDVPCSWGGGDGEGQVGADRAEVVRCACVFRGWLDYVGFAGSL